MKVAASVNVSLAVNAMILAVSIMPQAGISQHIFDSPDFLN